MLQQTALGILKQGKNVFLTGQAGSGKTYVLNQYIDWLRRHSIEPTITATTGIAATHIGGSTIHSWSGMGINDRLTPEIESDLLSRESLWKRIGQTRVLIIDEVSMMAPDFLDAVDQICRTVKEQPSQAFGGIQVVFSGDFFQLPPIVRGRAVDPKKRYAWQSTAWLEAEVVPCYLSEQYRQETEDSLLRILNDIRDGEATDDSLADLRERFDARPELDQEPVMLYTHNADVDQINQERLEEIPESPHYFEMTTKGSKTNVEKLKSGCLAPENLELRLGATVMFVRNNFEKNYVNGSMGTIVGFDEKTDWPLVDLYSGGVVMAGPEEWVTEEDGKKIAIISQVPLRLAWAITIHKSQGMSLDSAIIDLSKCFEVGQGYVALSRVRSMDGLFLRGFNATATQMDPLTIRVDKRFMELSSDAEEIQERVDSLQQEEYETNWIEQCGGSLDEVEYTTEQDRIRESTYEKTKYLLDQGYDIETMAEKRGLTVGTIVGHLLHMKHRGENIDTSFIEVDDEMVEMVHEAYEELTAGDDSSTGSGQTNEELYSQDGQLKLKPLYTMLDGEVDYDDIKMALLKIL